MRQIMTKILANIYIYLLLLKEYNLCNSTFMIMFMHLKIENPIIVDSLYISLLRLSFNTFNYTWRITKIITTTPLILLHMAGIFCFRLQYDYQILNPVASVTSFIPEERK